MPFIGNQPALSYTSFAKQDFTTSATTSYTLDNPVANANELALFINFVRQEPTTAYLQWYKFNINKCYICIR